MAAYFLFTIIGLAAGILVNYLADVLPAKRQLIAPICLFCGKEQSLFNYFIWPRRCEHCGKRRSLRTWVIEALFIASTLWLGFSQPPEIGFFAGIILLIFFGLVVVIDLEHRLILNPVSLVGAFIGLMIGINLHGLKSTLLGGIAGFCAMLILYYFGAALMSWLARRRGRELDEEALGFGDVNLGGILGLLLGWPGILIGLILTVLIAGIVSFIYLIYSLVTRRYRFDLAIPYGPFLISSAVALLFFRDFVLKHLGW